MPNSEKLIDNKGFQLCTVTSPSGDVRIDHLDPRVSRARCGHLLIGGYARAAHGYQRATTDVDVLVRATIFAVKNPLDRPTTSP